MDERMMRGRGTEAEDNEGAEPIDDRSDNLIGEESTAGAWAGWYMQKGRDRSEWEWEWEGRPRREEARRLSHHQGGSERMSNAQ